MACLHFKNNYNQGKCYFKLDKRVSDSELPDILVENIKSSGRGNNSNYPFTEQSVLKIKEALEKNDY